MSGCSGVQKLNMNCFPYEFLLYPKVCLFPAPSPLPQINEFLEMTGRTILFMKRQNRRVL